MRMKPRPRPWQPVDRRGNPPLLPNAPKGDAALSHT
jgi:hypothetical protein